jgi:hypothetical protein
LTENLENLSQGLVDCIRTWSRLSCFIGPGPKALTLRGHSSRGEGTHQNKNNKKKKKKKKKN